MAGNDTDLFGYDKVPYPVRSDLLDAQRRAWRRIGKAGTWLTAYERVQVAREARAGSCLLCHSRKAAISPYAITGIHDSLTSLPQPWIELIHCIVSNPDRLTQSWSKRVRISGITDEEYVEIVGIIATVTAVDTFAKAIGADPWPLPGPAPGDPTRYRPNEARQHEAWLPHIAWDEHGPLETDYFQGNPANIRMALTLVPDEARSFFDLVAHQYLPGPAMRDFEREHRAISHAQIELVAGRVSAINQCEY